MLEKLAKQSAIYGVSTILGRLLSYLLTPYYTRLFAPSEYGIITDLYALIPFALVLLTMGMESSYFRFSAKAEVEGCDAEDIARRKSTLFSTTWGVTIIASMVFAALAIVLREPISVAMGEAYVAQPLLVALVAMIILFDVVGCVPFSRLRERGEAHKFVMLKLFNIVLQVGLAVAFGAMGLFGSELGVGWVLIANLIASVVTLGVLIVVSQPISFPVGGAGRFSGALLGAILIYSIPLLLSGVASTATEFIDRQLIKYIIPEGAMAQLGIYGAVTKIAVAMTLFTQMYRLAAEPFFLTNFKKSEFVESNAAAMKYYFIASIAIFLGITLFQDLFALIVGREFREGIFILPVVLISNLLMGVWLNLSFWYKREEKTRFALYITLVGLVVTVVANLILIPRMGYYGAALARLTSEGAMVIFSYALSRRYYPIPFELGRIGEYVGVGALLYGVSVVIDRGVDNIWIVTGSSVVILVAYLTFATLRESIDIRALIANIVKRR